MKDNNKGKNKILLIKTNIKNLAHYLPDLHWKIDSSLNLLLRLSSVVKE